MVRFVRIGLRAVFEGTIFFLFAFYLTALMLLIF
jgi:hypothetical protein